MGRRGVLTLGVLVVLAAGAVVADVVVRDRVERQVADAVATELPGTEPTVRIGGTPFLTQVLAGSLDVMTVSAPAVTLDGLAMTDVVVRLADVTTTQPRTAGSAELEARLTPAALEQALALDGLSLTGEDGALVAATEVLGLPLAVDLVPRAAGRAVELDVVRLTIGEVEVGIEALPASLAAQLTGLAVPLDSLPPGVELTEVRVVGGVVLVEAGGTDLSL